MRQLNAPHEIVYFSRDLFSLPFEQPHMCASKFFLFLSKFIEMRFGFLSFPRVDFHFQLEAGFRSNRILTNLVVR